MLKKLMIGFLILSTTTLFSMSLSQVNSASKAELMEINGIGEVKAASIIKERKKGKFKSFEDLQRVEGIGEQTASNMKHNVKSSADVKKVKKSTKKKTSKKKTTTKKTTSSKKDTKAKTEKKTKKTKSKTKSDSKKKKSKSKKEKKTKK
jgi:competence protein ComEA